jgi:DnaJ-class molecular chaperone
MAKKSINREVAERILEREQMMLAIGITPCGTCHGAGWIIAKPTKRCPTCGGSGKAK